MALDTANALISVSDFKKFIGQTTSSTDYEGRYEDIINQVSWRFNSMTNRKLKARELTEYYDGTGGSQLYTKEWPINDSASEIDIRTDSDRSYSTSSKIGSTSIIIYSSEGKVILDGESFETGPQSIKLVYNAGYSTIPYELAYACKEACRLSWKREQDKRVGVKSESVEGGSVTFEMDMPWSVKTIVNMYKKRDDF